MRRAIADIKCFRDREDLLRREKIEVDLPRFVVRIFEREVEKANQGVDAEELVTLNNYIEYHLAEFITLADVAELERDVPGIGAAVWRWVEESNS